MSLPLEEHVGALTPGGFGGMRQIFRYNWHFYAAALALDAVALFLASRFPFRGVQFAAGFAAVLATFWAASSLLVSHYVYDRSHLYQWNWLNSVLKTSPVHWVNISAGLDQSSEALARLFPGSRRTILDIYSPAEMSEPSIHRARRVARPAQSAQLADARALPLDDGGCDTVLLIFAAHELRRREARVQLFREIGRALAPAGSVIVVEHLRDWNNFLAFGPGGFHFFSELEWLATFDQAGFFVGKRVGITPFVMCFVLSKADAATR